AWRRVPVPCESRDMIRTCLFSALPARFFLLFLCSASLYHLLVSPCHAAADSDPVDYQPLKARFAELVDAELAEGITPGFSVAWIADGKVVHSAGYGCADWEAKKPATADTIYRAGSISKLFNAIAVMQ